MWCLPEVTPEFLQRMEEVLALYEKPYDPDQPLVCFDEKSKQLIKDTRKVLSTATGKARRKDHEYKRNGTRNLFLAVEPKGGYRRVTVTERRTGRDFAKEVEKIASLKRYQKAKRLHIVLDNLNTHGAHSLTEAFGEEKTALLMEKIRFHHTPVHASWLNMAEIELAVLTSQCIKGRIPTEAKLKERVRHWQTARNRKKAMIAWRFTRAKARETFKYKPAILN